jgi:hypothetical protein
MSEYLLCKNIKHMRTVAHSPQQNGTAERKNRTIMAMARSAMIQAQIPYELWPHAVKYAAYTLNRLPTKAINWKTPFELWTGKQPNVSHLRPFGCKAFAHITNRKSLDPTSLPCTFLGYARRKKAAVLRIDDGTDRVITHRDVTYDENTMKQPQLLALPPVPQRDPDPRSFRSCTLTPPLKTKHCHEPSTKR